MKRALLSLVELRLPRAGNPWATEYPFILALVFIAHVIGSEVRGPLVQGNYFSGPLSATEASKLLTNGPVH
jgi:hypothetical protein